MNNNKILQQFHAMFGIFMVVFYIGGGIFFLFFADLTNRIFRLDKAIRGILGFTFLFYGIYRIYITYKQIAEAFFTKDKDEDQTY